MSATPAYGANQSVAVRNYQDLHGVNILFTQAGGPGYFDLQTLILTLVAGFALLACVKTVANFCLMYVMPRKDDCAPRRVGLPRESAPFFGCPAAGSYAPQLPSVECGGRAARAAHVRSRAASATLRARARFTAALVRRADRLFVQAVTPDFRPDSEYEKRVLQEVLEAKRSKRNKVLRGTSDDRTSGLLAAAVEPLSVN